ncbi:hypothetical protein BRADI_4g35284v3 [Brachypodium distachyon]|uniref:Uncharacterized protein n=1 Tax=Brachypodium distachyon TaxID=15368 RepID=A0A2K2CSG0_BRADI|nr:hypothetical protein BRADI_4g35284v3 [Brachypodium distachyon]
MKMKPSKVLGNLSAKHRTRFGVGARGTGTRPAPAPTRHAAFRTSCCRPIRAAGAPRPRGTFSGDSTAIAGQERPSNSSVCFVVLTNMLGCSDLCCACLQNRTRFAPSDLPCVLTPLPPLLLLPILSPRCHAMDDWPPGTSS